MSQLNFRDTEQKPQRKYSGKELKDYKGYKDALEQDFYSKCGYTFCQQDWFGGKRNFQIDHFKPKLVYSCSYVNRAKSNDIGNYIDPCDVDYNEHFYRDELGNIYPVENSEAAKYMYKKLKLYLKRYGIIWMLEQLETRMSILRELIEQTGDADAKELFIAITFQYMNYKKIKTAIL